MNKKQNSWPMIVGSGVYYILVVTALCLLYREKAWQTLYRIEVATNGFFAVQLILPLLALMLFFPLLFGIGRLQLTDVGLRPSNIVSALWVGASFCLVINLWVFIDAVFFQHSCNLVIRQLDELERSFVSLVVQLLGSALVEEVVFRGYFFAQIYGKLSLYRWKTSLFAASLFTQLAFSMSHLPHRFVIMELNGAEAAKSVLWLFPFGLLLTQLYAVTNNLFICIVLHAIWNAPFLLLQGSREQFENAWWVLASILLCGCYVRSWLITRP